MKRDEYGENYQDHLLEQYKLYVEMADRVSQRRDQSNRFYVTIISALVALLVVLGAAGGCRLRLGGGAADCRAFRGHVVAHLVAEYPLLPDAQQRQVRGHQRPREPAAHCRLQRRMEAAATESRPASIFPTHPC